MKTRRKNKLRCSAVPEPCVQLCIKRMFTSCVWRLHILHSLTLTSEPSAILTVVMSWSGNGNKNFWKWNGNFRSDRTDCQRGPPLEVDYFDHKISTCDEPFHLRLDQNFRKIWHNGKHQWFPPAFSTQFTDTVNKNSLSCRRIREGLRKSVAEDGLFPYRSHDFSCRPAKDINKIWARAGSRWESHTTLLLICGWERCSRFTVYTLIVFRWS